MSAIADKVMRVIRPEILALRAYHVPDATGLVKLDAMENPYVWPEPLKRQWLERLHDVAINRYPDPSSRALRDRLRESLGLPARLELLLGNGSDELIQLILMGVARPGACVVAPVPTFVMYEMIAKFLGLEFVGVPLAEDFALDLSAMKTAICVHRPAVVFLAYPNNPTGNLFDDSAMDAILQAAPGLVVVDEAYNAFALRSYMDQLGRYDNLLVLRTLSKQGLAGLRLGMLAGDPAWLSEFDKLRLPYNINVLTQASAEFVLSHAQILDAQTAQIRADREWLYHQLERLTGVHVWPSAANFLLFRTTRPAGRVFAELRRRGILIKNLDSAGGALDECLRVTIGTSHENALFLDALAQALEAS
ncbi:MAG: histidinol-phosphate transaminase [Acidiferrobacterales bacterium]